MLEKYDKFIRNVLNNKNYLNNSLVSELLKNSKKNGNFLYTSNLIIDGEDYYLLIAFFKDRILINSKLTRTYFDNGYEGYVKEEYIDEEIDSFTKKDNNIYYISSVIKRAYLEYEYSSLKTIVEEKKASEVYKNTSSFNEIKFKSKKTKTKNLFCS